MPNTIGRNLNLCFSKIMRPLLSPETPSSSTPQLPTSASTINTTCPSSIFIKNFNSLYDPTLTLNDNDNDNSDGGNTPIEAELATAFASRRFFFSSPGRSNSIVESASHRHNQQKQFLENSVAVATYSPDPYLDFRRSMQEMVEARAELRDVGSNWEMLHELLLCYLALNPKSTHKYIVAAFADLLVTLMPNAHHLALAAT